MSLIPLTRRLISLRVAGSTSCGLSLLIGVVFLGDHATGQPQPPAAAPGGDVPAVIDPDQSADVEDEAGAALPRLFLPDRNAARALRLADNWMQSDRQTEAVEMLQSVIDADADLLVEAEDGPGERFVSSKTEAERLLRDAPPEVRQSYELKFGVAAQARLTAAIDANDWGAVGEIARRYSETAAGDQALFRLAVRAQDRGDFVTAADLFRRLREKSRRRFEPELALRLAQAEQALGDAAAAESLLAELQQQRDLRWGGSKILATTLPKLIDQQGRTASMANWPWAGGTADRNADSAAASPAGGLAWMTALDVPPPFELPEQRARWSRLEEALSRQQQESKLSDVLRIPAMQPIVVGDVAVARTFGNLRAFDLATGALRWETVPSQNSLFDRVTTDLAQTRVSDIEDHGTFLELYTRQRAWRDLTSGTLSSDGRRVFAIEGAGIFATGLQPFIAGIGSMPERVGMDTFNTLAAYDLAADGRFNWSLGGPSLAPGTETNANALRGRFFLGAPLPVGESLAVLSEHEDEISLVMLRQRENAPPRVEWTQPLLRPEQAIDRDPLRRLSGVSPAAADGLLVCPTAAGAVVAVDPVARRLAWGYQYPRRIVDLIEQGGQQRQTRVVPDHLDRWLDAVPIIAGGCVLLTPRDSDDLHCLELRTGRLLWRKPREGRLYLAGVLDDRVIVVGRDAIEAFDLRSGESTDWNSIPIPKPAGRGVRSGDRYFLTFQNGEIGTFDLRRGRTLGRAPLGIGMEGGNLVAASGRMVLLNASHAAAFNSLAESERFIQAGLGGDQPDPVALALRGELRLHAGETVAGWDDLRRAAHSPKAARARQLVLDAYLQDLKTNFPRYREQAEQIRPFAIEPSQRALFHRLLAEGLAEHGEPVAAMQEYVALIEPALTDQTLATVGDSGVARGDRVLRAEITSVYRNADSAQRQQIDRVLNQSLARLDVEQFDEVRNFSALFYHLPAGIAAMRRLEDITAAISSPLQREQQLLSRLNQTELVAAREEIITQLERLYAQHQSENVPNGGVVPSRWPSRWDVDFEPLEVADQRARGVDSGFAVDAIGPVPPAFEGWRFELDPPRRSLTAFDGYGRIRWTATLADGEMPAVNPYGVEVRFCGHLMAVTVPGRMIVFDTLSEPNHPQRLWHRDLTERYGTIALNGFGLRPVLLPGGRQRTVARDPLGRPLGGNGFAGTQLLVYQQGTVVTAADPLTGEMMWRRTDLPRGCEIGGDAEFVILQPPEQQDVIVLRTADGVTAQRVETVDAVDRVGWVGTKLAFWSFANDRRTRDLVCRDVARSEKPIWQLNFPDDIGWERLPPREIGLLDAAGTFTVVTLETGQRKFVANLPDAEGIDRFLPLKGGFGYLVLTHRPTGGQSVRMESNHGWASVHGGVYLLAADDGRVLWSTAMGPIQFIVEQPLSLPTLLFTGGYQPVGAARFNRGLLLDQRTGAILFEQDRLKSFAPFQGQLLPGSQLQYMVHGGRITVTPELAGPSE